MLVVSTELRVSPIHGIGTFLLVPVRKDALIWRFDSRIDRIYSEDDFTQLPPLTQAFVKKYAMWNQSTQLWVLDGDHGRHFNHSLDPTTTVVGHRGFGDIVAARNLDAGEELTSDYNTICDGRQKTGELW